MCRAGERWRLGRRRSTQPVERPDVIGPSRPTPRPSGRPRTPASSDDEHDRPGAGDRTTPATAAGGDGDVHDRVATATATATATPTASAVPVAASGRTLGCRCRAAGDLVASPDAVSTMSRHVFEGPRWYRSRIRSRGPFLRSCPAVGARRASSLLLLNVFDGKTSGYVGLVLRGVRRAGAAGRRRPVLQRLRCTRSASTLSVMLWLIVGAIAAARTTRNPMADWADFWRDYAWLAGGIWLGAPSPCHRRLVASLVG